MSEQVESKATDAAEEVVDATVDAVAEIEDAVEADLADVVAEAAAVEAEAEEAVAEAVAEAAAIEEAVEEAVVEAVEAGADDETVAEMIDEVAEIEEAVEAEVAEVIAEADAIEEAAEEAVTEAVAEAVAIEEATEEAAAELVAEAVEGAEEMVAEAAAEAVAIEEATEEAAAELVAEAVEGAEEVVAEEVVAEEEAAPADAAAADATADTDEAGRVVRVLSVGMEVDGKVKRITEFGAFVDIGVGRDGLVHISEMSVRRVAKVSDVLKEGQEVKAWIKQLDRERNRISLTLIPPGVVTIRDLEKGDLVNGTVTRIVPYGAFVDIGVGRDALLHIREMAEGYVKRPEDVVQVGEELEARIIDLSKRRGRIDLSIKGLRPEPQAEVAEEAAEAAVAAEEEALDDPFADVEVLSPIELAFQKAMAENEDDVTGMRKKKGKRARRAEQIAIQDEIIARTLEGRD